MTFNFWLTWIWSARSPSVRATRSEVSVRVTAMDFGDHLVDYSGFTLYRTGPDALVLRLGRRGGVMVGLAMDAEQAFHDLLGGSESRAGG
jgi:hypothetical protein